MLLALRTSPTKCINVMVRALWPDKDDVTSAYMLTHDTRHAKVSTDGLGHPLAEHANVNEYKTQLHEGEYGKVKLLSLLQMKEVL